MRLALCPFVVLLCTHSLCAQDDRYMVTTLARGITHTNLEGLAFDATRNVLYTPSGPSGNAFQINGANGAVAHILSGIHWPQGGAVDGDGYYYVSSWGSGQILRYDPAGPSVGVFAAGPQGPAGLAVDPSGDTLYVANWSNSTIYKTPLGRGQLTRFVSGNGITNPDGLAFDAAGNLYVAMAQSGNAKVMQVTPEGEVCMFVDIEEADQTGYIAVHANTLYVAGHGSHKVYAVDLPTQAWRVLAGTGQPGLRDGKASEAVFASPQGIAVSPDGLQIYVVDPPNRAIRVISKTLTEVGVEAATVHPRITLAQNYPNPFRHSTTVGFSLPEAQAITLDLYTTAGRLVQTLARGLYPAGAHELQVVLSHLTAGSYLLRLTTTQGTFTHTISRVH